MKHKALLLLALALLSVSCKTQKICTSDSRDETTKSEVVKTDSVATSHTEKTEKNDSVVIETTIERETIVTVDQDGNEIKRETNTNKTTNRDHFRDLTKKVEDKQEAKHEDIQKKDSTLIQNHSEEKVIIKEPSLWDRLRQSLADIIIWVFVAAMILLIAYHYWKKWQGKKQ